MILVTGATGHFGKTVIDHLLKTIPASQVAAFVRDENKAAELKAKGVNIRIGSYDDVASIENAVKGIDKVLLVSGMDMSRLQQHSDIIAAAKKAGVQHIAYTGVAMEDLNTSATKMLMDSHFQTEEVLKQSGLQYTFLRNSIYLDMVPVYVGPHALETGIVFPAGNGKTSFALRSEMAEAAANVLLQPGHDNKIYHITGGEASSFNDIAGVLSALSGKSLPYTDIDPAAFENQLKQVGVPEIGVMITAAFATDIRASQFDVVSTDLEKLLGRKPASLREGLKAVFNL